MKKEFTVDRDGKTFVLYAGLLDLAHERGLKAITTTLVQIPNEMNANTAICHATVETERGTFTGLGDANPANVNRMMSPHLIRMAETRAKARALRDAVNVGVTALEELADLDEIEPELPRPSGSTRSATYGANGTAHGKGGLRSVEAPDFFDDEPAALSPRANSQSTSRNGHANGQANDHSSSVAVAERPAGGPPATPKQLETIARMARAAGKSVETDGLSRAQASEIISSLIGEMGQLRAS